MKKIIFLLIALLSIHCSKSQDNNEENNAMAQKILLLVNQYRAQDCNCGANKFTAVPPVKLNAKLIKAAQAHSDDMLQRNQMSHYGKDGQTPSQRLNKVGYLWATWAENVAAGQPNEESVMKAWMESAGHCANIMNPQMTEVGVARSGKYWTILFAVPR